jgi:hypothetical protein
MARVNPDTGNFCDALNLLRLFCFPFILQDPNLSAMIRISRAIPRTAIMAHVYN